MTNIRNFASYNLLNLHSPPPDKEYWHCDMKRGFIKARKRHPQVKALLNQDNVAQKIGLLAQKAVYEWHQNYVTSPADNLVFKVAEILDLDQELPSVKKRVSLILEKYHKNPILLAKKIIKLSRGDESFPEPILIKKSNYVFNLYAAIDCIFEEEDGTIHILDFKTGSSNFDRRQAYIYLLAAQYLYPHRQAVASFYNLEIEVWSEKITANSVKLEALEEQLIKVSKKHQKELKAYGNYDQNFQQIFSPNPGFACNYCPVNSICPFSTIKISA